MIELADVQAAAERLEGVAHRTPVVTSDGANWPARIRAIASDSSASSAGTSAAVNVVDTTASARSTNVYATSTSVAPARKHASA